MNKEQECSTRKAILTMLKMQGPLSAGDMAKSLGITEMAVRRHLNTLERDNLIEAKISRQAVGRPSNLYSLTACADELFPKNYHLLTLDLLGALEAEAGEGSVDRLFEGRQQKLYNKHIPRLEGKEIPERVKEFADIQNTGGYMVELDKDEAGRFIFNEYNCPITQVANRYEHACRCELALFQKLLQADVERVECIANGGAKCSYLITPKGQEPSGSGDKSGESVE